MLGGGGAKHVGGGARMKLGGAHPPRKSASGPAFLPVIISRAKPLLLLKMSK